MESTKLNPKFDLPPETLSTLAEIGQEINSSLNLDEVLPSAASLIKRLIDYEIFAVLLPEEGENAWVDRRYYNDGLKGDGDGKGNG